jgi:tetratricopeptide (TPR) repeat protein
MMSGQFSPSGASRRQLLLICLFLLAAVLAGYGRSVGRNFTFVNADDDEYVMANSHVQEGLTLDSIRWAFTSFDAYNWHPLTWLSLELDYQLYGLWAPGFHLTNVLFHAANTLVLFLLLQRLTGAVWCSAAAAAFFGVHPAHVESVAWVTERKDVLSTLFWLLTMAAYAWYAARPGFVRYLLVVLGLGLGLLAKPMVVTLPAVLLLLDVWPLRRWPEDKQAVSSFAPASWRRLLLEKVPLFLLVAATIPLTLGAQQGTIRTLDQLPFSFRVANSLIAYVKYIGLLLWPSGLAIYYPHSFQAPPLWQPVGAAVLLAGVTVAVCWNGRSRPYLAVGWLWYLGTLVPVIGLVQVGTHELADRYLYVPSIGLSLALIWGIADIAARRHVPRAALASLAGVALACCLLLTWRQVAYWKDSETLWKRDLAVTRESALAHDMLASALLPQRENLRKQLEKLREAREHLRRALSLERRTPSTHGNLGAVQERLGEWEEAAQQYELAMQTEWQSEKYRDTKEKCLLGLGRVRERQRRFPEAQKCYAALLEIHPKHVGAHIGLASTLEEQGDFQEAQKQYEEALRLEPNSAALYNDLGRILQRQQKPAESLEYFDRSLQLHPDSAETWNNKGIAQEQLGRWEAARECYQRAVKLDSEQLTFHCNLAYALQASGQTAQAKDEYVAASRIYPAWTEAALQQAWNLATSADAKQRNGRQALRIAKQVCQATDFEAPQSLEVLAAAHAELGQFAEAVKWQRKTVSLLPADLSTDIRKGVEERLHLYEKHQPYRPSLGGLSPKSR